jgi:hypothetical protein
LALGQCTWIKDDEQFSISIRVGQGNVEAQHFKSWGRFYETVSAEIYGQNRKRAFVNIDLLLLYIQPRNLIIIVRTGL